MTSTNNSFTETVSPPLRDFSPGTTTPRELSAYTHNQALIPAPLFADKPQILAKRTKTAPTRPESGEVPPSLERSYTVNASAARANDFAVTTTNRHSQNLIEDFLKSLTESPETPRNLIDDFLNGLAQGTKPRRRMSGQAGVQYSSAKSEPRVDQNSFSHSFNDLSSSRPLTSTVINTLQWPLERASARFAEEATGLATIEELPPLTASCDSPYPEARIPNNIPRRRPVSGDLRAEYKRAGRMDPLETGPLPENAVPSPSRPVLSLNTNIEAWGPNEFLKPRKAENTTRPQSQRPALTLNTNVDTFTSNSFLECEAGKHVEAFYLGLINGDIDPAAYMDLSITTSCSSFHEAELTEKSVDATELASAVSKTELELEDEKHEESFYSGLINNDSDSETSSKRADSAVDSPVSPPSAIRTSAGSTAPSPTSSFAVVGTALIIQVPSPIENGSSSEKAEEGSSDQFQSSSNESDESDLSNLVATSNLTRDEPSSCSDDGLHSLHGSDETELTECTCEPQSESQLTLERQLDDKSESQEDRWLDGTEATRQYWDQQSALNRHRRRSASRRSRRQVDMLHKDVSL